MRQELDSRSSGWVTQSSGVEIAEPAAAREDPRSAALRSLVVMSGEKRKRAGVCLPAFLCWIRGCWVIMATSRRSVWRRLGPCVPQSRGCLLFSN